LTLLQNQIVLSFESEAEVLSTLRYAQMYGFDLLGETLWSIPIKGKEGSYLFDITRSSGSDTSTKMIITLEKGSISLFEAEKL